MIGYLRGTISHLLPEYCLMDVQGVGYRIFIAAATRQKLSVGAETVLFTYLHVREDALLLYGFLAQDEYDLFIHLTSVSGIGPKVTMGILSAIAPQDFCSAVYSKNMAVLTKLPGIGKKTAERIILELKDKIGREMDQDNREDNTISPAMKNENSVLEQSMQALQALGYNQAEFMPVLRKLSSTTQTVEALIRLTLREMSRR